MISEAGIGRANWDGVNAAVATAIPGAMSALVCQSSHTGAVRFGSSAGIEDKLVDQYIGHYARCNPWNLYWTSAAPGTILDTLRQFPSRRFARSEFYNDWLTKLGDRRDDGIGIKLKTAHGDMVFLSVQIPESILLNKGRTTKAFFQDLAGPLVRAIEMNSMLGERIDRSLVASTLLARAEIAALVIDDRRVIRDVNAKAEYLLRDADILCSRIGMLSLKSTGAQNWLTATLRDFDRLITADSHRHQFLRGKTSCMLTLHRLPDIDLTGYVFRRPLFLLQIDLGDPTFRRVDYDIILAQRFALTPAERNLCTLLARGHSLFKAAEGLNITRETARDRLKAIFRKTDTHRQSELVALLLRMGQPEG